MLLQVYEEVKAELKLRGGYIMSPEECKKAGNTIIKEGRLNAGRQEGLVALAPGLLHTLCDACTILLVRIAMCCLVCRLLYRQHYDERCKYALLQRVSSQACHQPVVLCTFAVQMLSGRRPQLWPACSALRCPPALRC